MRIIICILSFFVTFAGVIGMVHTTPISEDDYVIAPYQTAEKTSFIIFIIFELILIFLSLKKCETWKERIKYIALPTIYIFVQNMIIGIIATF